MANLINLSEYKTYADITSADALKDSKIQTLINNVSALIKTYCGRNFIDNYSTEKIEYFDGDGSSWIYLQETPIRDISQVWERLDTRTDKETVENNFADSSNYYLLNSATAQCSDSSLSTEATCAYITGSVASNGTGGTSGDTLTIQTFDADSLLGEVGRQYRVQIETGGATFKWSRDGGANFFKTGVACSTTATELEHDVKVTFSAASGLLVGDYWDFTANKWTGACSNSTYKTQTDCQSAGYFWTVDREYVLDSENDRVHRIAPDTGKSKAFPSGPDAIKVTYRGGYSETPNDLKLAAFDLVTYYRKKESIPRKITSASGMGSVTHAGANLPADFPPHIKRILDLYRNAL